MLIHYDGVLAMSFNQFILNEYNFISDIPIQEPFILYDEFCGDGAYFSRISCQSYECLIVFYISNSYVSIIMTWTNPIIPLQGNIFEDGRTLISSIISDFVGEIEYQKTNKTSNFYNTHIKYVTSEIKYVFSSRLFMI